MSVISGASSSSSRVGRDGRVIGGSVSAMLTPVLTVLQKCRYPTKMVSFGVFFEALQTFAFALNPHLPGNRIAWTLFFVTQLPFWDGFVAHNVDFSAFLGFFWATVLIVALCVGGFAVAVLSPKMLLHVSHGRHLLHLVAGPMYIPIVATLVTPMACAEVYNAAGRRMKVVWLFPSQECYSSVLHEAHYGIAIAALIAFLALTGVMSTSCYEQIHTSTRFKARAHSLMDSALWLYRGGLVVAFHLLMARGMASTYTFIVAAASFVVAAGFAYIHPYYLERTNRLAVATHAATGWCATAMFISVKLDRGSDYYIKSGGFYATLVCGCFGVVGLFLFLSESRLSRQTKYLLRMALVPGFVPPHENPFAMAAKRGNADLLPYPSGLPSSDYIFSSVRHVECEIVADRLRAEELEAKRARASGLMANGDERTGSEDDEDSEHDDRDAADEARAELEKQRKLLSSFIGRVQVVSPTITAVRYPTDVEFAIRFLREWFLVIGVLPTPHMLSFACRIMAKGMLRFSRSPLIVLHFASFLGTYAASTSRLTLALNLVESLPNKYSASLGVEFHASQVAATFKTLLGLRDRSHQVVFAKAREAHKDALVTMTSLWRRIKAVDGNVTQLLGQASIAAHQRADGYAAYVSALSTGSGDEVMLRSFATYLETVMLCPEAASMAREEADLLGLRRRSALVDAAATEEEEGRNGGPKPETEGDSYAGGGRQQSQMSATSSVAQQEQHAASLRAVFEAAEEQLASYEGKLTATGAKRMVFAVFFALLLIVALTFGVALGAFSSQRRSLLDINSLAETRQATHRVIGSSAALSSLLRNANTTAAELAYAVARTEAEIESMTAFVNEVTVGEAASMDPDMTAHLAGRSVGVVVFSSAGEASVETVGMWMLCRRVLAAANDMVRKTRRAGSDRQALAAVSRSEGAKFMFFNGPRTISLALDQWVKIGDESSRESAAWPVVIAATCATFFVATIVALVVGYGIRTVCNRRAMTLRLFQCVPNEVIERMATDAKARVEAFVSGTDTHGNGSSSADGSNGSVGTPGVADNDPASSTGAGRGILPGVTSGADNRTPSMSVAADPEGQSKLLEQVLRRQSTVRSVVVAGKVAAAFNAVAFAVHRPSTTGSTHEQAAATASQPPAFALTVSAAQPANANTNANTTNSNATGEVLFTGIGAPAAPAQAAQSGPGSSATPQTGSPLTSSRRSRNVSIADSHGEQGGADGGKPRAKIVKDRRSMSLAQVEEALAVSRRQSVVSQGEDDDDMPTDADMLNEALGVEGTHGGSATHTERRDPNKLARRDASEQMGWALFCLVILTSFALVGLSLAALSAAKAYKHHHDEQVEVEGILVELVTHMRPTRAANLNRFVASGTLQAARIFFKSFIEARGLETELLGSAIAPATLEKYAIRSKLAKQEEERQVMAASLVASLYNLSLQSVPQVSGVEWSAWSPLLTEIEAYAAFFATTPFLSYSSSSTTRTLPTAQRRALLNELLYGEVTMSNLADIDAATSAMLKTQSEVKVKLASEFNQKQASLTAAAIALNAVAVVVLLVLLAGTQQQRRTTMVWVLSTVLVVCGATFVSWILMTGPQVDTIRSTEAFQLLDEGTSAISRRLAESMSLRGYIYTGFPNLLMFHISIVAQEPRASDTAFFGGVLGADGKAAWSAASAERAEKYLETISIVREMSVVALQLAMRGFGETRFLSHAMFARGWDFVSPPWATEERLAHPHDFNEYAPTTKAQDLAPPRASPSRHLRMAEQTLLMHRAVEAETDRIMLMSEAVSDRFVAMRSTSLAYYDRTQAAMGLSVALAAVSALSVLVGIYLALQRAGEAKDSAEAVGVAMHHIRNSTLAILVLAAFLSAASITALVVLKLRVDEREVLLLASERASHPNEVSTVVNLIIQRPDGVEITDLFSMLDEILFNLQELSHEVYFTGAFALRAAQNDKLFGAAVSNPAVAEKATLPTVSSSSSASGAGASPAPPSSPSSSSSALNDASGGGACIDSFKNPDGTQRAAEVQYQRFVGAVLRLASFPRDVVVDEFLKFPARRAVWVGVDAAAAEILRIASTVGESLNLSRNDYLATLQAQLGSSQGVVIALFAATFVVASVEFLFVFYPMMQSLEVEELGLKMLLLFIPEEARTAPDIVDFFLDVGNSADEQIKKNLQQSEKLLQNILPPVIARRLKSGESPIADDHESISVVFAALYGFDEYSSTMVATELVVFLNELMCTFDHIVDLMEIEKIKTIGDVYFMCGGLTKKTEKDHALRAMECSLMFMDALSDHCIRHNTPNMRLKIGIHTGQVVAGVIGSKKVAYDMWGDTVNTASRMYSTGTPGMIQISTQCHAKGGLAAYYEFDEGEVIAKGKGKLLTYLVKGRKGPNQFSGINWRRSMNEI